MLKANRSSLLTLACLLATMTAACASAKPQPAAEPSPNAAAHALLVHEIVNLAHAPASQIAKTLQQALGQQGVHVAVDARTNRLILTGLADEVAAASALIARLDTPTPAPQIKP